MGMVQWLLLVLLLILAVSNVTFQFTFFQSGASYDLCPSWKSFSGKLPIRVNSIKGTKSEMYHKSSFTYRNFSLRFYWFVPAEKPEDEFPPLLIWLQGGPGSSSLLGFFHEIGPCKFNEENQLVEPRQIHWARKYHVVFFDNPVGTGYSSAESHDLLAKNVNDASVDLYTALCGLYEKFPYLTKSKLFLTGESYAGKYIPAFAYYLLKQNSFHLSGIAIGNPFVSPAKQADVMAENAYNNGWIDLKTKTIIENMQKEIQSELKKGNNLEALDIRMKIYEILSKNNGGVDFYDIRRNVLDAPKRDRWYKWLNSENTRKRLNVWPGVFHRNRNTVIDAMKKDIMESSEAYINALLNNFNIPILIYEGIFDFRDGVRSTLSWLEYLEWDGIKEFNTAEIFVWGSPENIYGTFKQSSKLTHAIVHNAGHMVPETNSHAAYEMISSWIDFGVLRKRTLKPT